MDAGLFVIDAASAGQISSTVCQSAGGWANHHVSDRGSTVGDLHRFTVEDYHRMAEAGILHEDSRVELIRGRIVDMSPVGSAHIVAVNRLNRLLVAAVGDCGVVSVQNPVRLDKGSEPQPDLAVLRPGADNLGSPTPRASEVLLLIEVADSTLHEGRDEKAPLYAASGVPEYWILNLVDQVFEVYRRPEAGRYLEVHKVGSGGKLDMVMLPDVRLEVSLVLGTQPP